MALAAGTRLGPYEVTAQIGAGGMGEVYRARDSKLGREVAIKVLPEEFTQHPQKLARFEREARLLAGLNHPGIATLHGLEEAEGKPFLVMEVIEGKTLAERIARGPIPVNEALAISQQIAEALEDAHEHGVIHRDLKPGNVKITPEGQVKVLDFGLAKAFGDDIPESDLSQSPTLSRDETQAGVILGTAIYMSPEQARGKAVDKRTDIFSFGAVLYEMLTGKKAFPGADVSDVLAAVIRSEPDWKALPANVPPSVIKLLRRCLTKDRKERLQAIGDVRFEIREILSEPETAVASKAARARIPRVWQALAGVFAVAFLATLWLFWQTVSAPELTVRLSVNLGAGDYQLAPGSYSWAVLSPDGKMLAFVGQAGGQERQLYIRSLDSLEATPLSGTEGASAPFFSPRRAVAGVSLRPFSQEGVGQWWRGAHDCGGQLLSRRHLGTRRDDRLYPNERDRALSRPCLWRDSGRAHAVERRRAESSLAVVSTQREGSALCGPGGRRLVRRRGHRSGSPRYG